MLMASLIIVYWTYQNWLNSNNALHYTLTANHHCLNLHKPLSHYICLAKSLWMTRTNWLSWRHQIKINKSNMEIVKPATNFESKALFPHRANFRQVALAFTFTLKSEKQKNCPINILFVLSLSPQNSRRNRIQRHSKKAWWGTHSCLAGEGNMRKVEGAISAHSSFFFPFDPNFGISSYSSTSRSLDQIAHSWNMMKYLLYDRGEFLLITRMSVGTYSISARFLFICASTWQV